MQSTHILTFQPGAPLLPIPFSLSSFGTYRDSGSLSASFLSEDGLEHTLLFRLNPGTDAEGRITARFYLAPVLEKYVDIERVSRVSGRITIDVRRETLRLSWDEASEILEKIESLAEENPAENHGVLEAMRAVAAAEGRPDQA